MNEIWSSSRREFLRKIFVGAFGLSIFRTTAYSKPVKLNKKLNIIFILADDLGYGDLECTGHPYVKTPNINKLANQGTLFTQFYVAGPTCAPSRIGFMTGLFPNRLDKRNLGKTQFLTKLLKENGYKNCHVGKWDLGSAKQDEDYGIDYPKKPTLSKKQRKNLKKNRKSDPRGRDARHVDEAIEFINGNKDVPFYMNVWLHSTHPAINPPESYIKKYSKIKVDINDFKSEEMQNYLKYIQKKGFDISKCMRAYCGDVATLDEQVGRILDKLDELNLTKKTMVVFSSDNGPSTGLHTKKDKDKIKKYRQNEVGSPGIFRGRKHSLYDGGIHTPFIVRWPGKVPAGKIDSKSILAGVDWLPTICSIAGIKSNLNNFDGEDVSDIICGRYRSRKKAIIFQRGRNEIAMRDGKWKIHIKENDKIKLYDLLQDPSEKRNVFKKYPEVVDKLMTKIRMYKNSISSAKNKS